MSAKAKAKAKAPSFDALAGEVGSAPAHVSAPALKTEKELGVEANAEAEYRAGRIALLREGVCILEEIAGWKAETREQHHPLNENRKPFMDAMKPALAVLGREGSKEKGVTPATEAEIAGAMNVAAGMLSTATGGAYKRWDAQIKRWLGKARAS